METSDHRPQTSDLGPQDLGRRSLQSTGSYREPKTENREPAARSPQPAALLRRPFLVAALGVDPARGAAQGKAGAVAVANLDDLGED